LQGELPCYLAPEQAWGRAKEIGPATDVYALGAILFELVSGQPPFRSATAADTLDAIQGREAPPLSRFRSRVPRDLEAICRKCLAKQPRRRYASAHDLADDLRRCADRYPIKARSAGKIERFGKWLRRNVRVLAWVFLGLWLGASLIGLIEAGRERSSAPPSREQGYRQTISRLESASVDLRRREAVANYQRYLILAERAVDNRDMERGRELLERCPPEQRHWEWQYLHGRLQNLEQTTRFQAKLPIACLDVSGDGRYLAAGGKGEVSVWDVETRQLILHWNLPVPVRSVAFRPDSACIAVVGSSAEQKRDGRIEVRALRTGLPLFARPFADSEPTSVAYSADGQDLLVGSDDSKVHILRPENGDEVRNYAVMYRQILPRGPHARMLPMPQPHLPERLAVISPDGGQIALLTDLRASNPPTFFNGRDDTTFFALAYDRHKEKLAAAALDGTICLWDLRFPSQTTTVLRGHKGAVTGVSFSNDGKRLASCGVDGSVRIWDTEQGVELLVLTGYNGASGVLFRTNAEDAALAQRGMGMVENEYIAIAHGNTATILKPQ
jgi:hypothetical protein